MEQDSPSDDEETFETDEEDNIALRVPAKTKLCKRRQTEPISRENKLKLMQQDRLTQIMKMITETSGLVQTLVSHLMNQESNNTSKKNQQQANADFQEKGKSSVMHAKSSDT